MLLDSCVSFQTIPYYRSWVNITTPGACLAKCRDRNYTYAGVVKEGRHPVCYCGHASPEYARVHPSQCSMKCPGTNKTCGADSFFTVVGPGYPSNPAYCAHENSLPYYQYNNHTLGPKDCVKKCASRGHFSWAGLKGSTCYCGARQPGREWVVEESKCNANCDGRVPHHGCGGEDVVSVYKVDKTADRDIVAPEISASTVGKIH